MPFRIPHMSLAVKFGLPSGVSLVMGAAQAAPLDAEHSWLQHPDVVQWIFMACISTITWFAVRSFLDIQKEQRDIRDTVHNLEREFFTLKGSHYANHVNDDQQP